MEERKLNEKESLELITRMMQNTKMNLEVGSGNHLIIWGVSTLLTSIVVYTLLYFTQSYMSFWAWMLNPLVGVVWTKLADRSRVKVITRFDKIVRKLWSDILYIAVSLPIVLAFIVWNIGDDLVIAGYKVMSLIPCLEIMIVSLGLIVNAWIIDFIPLRIGGFVGVLLSLTALCDSLLIQTIMFGIWAIATMIIPGIKLNLYIKSSKNA